MENSLRLKRLKHARDVMVRVQNSKKHKFDLSSWCDNGSKQEVKTESRAVACGQSACFGGWLALDAQCIAEGLYMVEYGPWTIPGYQGHQSVHAIAAYLGITQRHAEILCVPSEYNCHVRDITPQDVICRLDKVIKHYEAKDEQRIEA
jgi:hypothetical protein